MSNKLHGVVEEFRRQPAIGFAELSIVVVGLVWAFI